LSHAVAWSRVDWLLLVLVTGIGGVLRFYKLGEVPPGFQFDEAFNAIDASQVLHGNFPRFLPANGGREVAYTYFQAGLGWLFGLNVYTLRLASALLGIGAVAATFVLLRRILRRESRAIATFTSVTLAISVWHLHFSHYGIRVISMPLLLSALFGAYWLGVFGDRRRQRLVAFLVAGLLTGLSVWTNPTGRFVPFVLIAFTAWLWFRGSQHRRLALDSPLGGLLLTGVVAFLVHRPRLRGFDLCRTRQWWAALASIVDQHRPRAGDV
jgi:4-amino-4-deoxy-L-arabinose transferase-like glycosyltransferase